MDNQALPETVSIPAWVWPLIIGNVITALATYTAIRSDLAVVMERTGNHDKQIERLDDRIRNLERPMFRKEKMLDKHPMT